MLNYFLISYKTAIMPETMPESLVVAAAMEPAWLRWWFRALLFSNLAAIFFILHKVQGKWRVRPESTAILLSFVAVGIMMNWMYAKVGYVRLLGLPHLIFWTPIYFWMLSKFRRDTYTGPFRYYVFFYLVIIGASLVIDTSDLIRYLLGDHRPLHLN